MSPFWLICANYYNSQMKRLLTCVISVFLITCFSHSQIRDKSTKSPNVYYLSAFGAISDADIDKNSISFGTDNTTVIQQVLDKAQFNPIIIYWDGKYSVTGLKIYSNTKIIAFEGCGAILRNNSDRCLLSNVNWSTPSSIDCNISIQGGIWNGNGFNDMLTPAQVHDSAEDGWICAFRFINIRNLTFKDAIIYKPRTFSFHVQNAENVFIQNVKINVGETAPINCDGLSFVGPVKNVTIRDCTILAKDDHIAFNADIPLELKRENINKIYRNCFGDITDITIDNVKLEGGLFGIRLLSCKSRIDNITIKNIHGVTKEYWLVIDNYWQNSFPINNPGDGNIGNIFIENVNVESEGKYVSFPVHHSYANIDVNADCIAFKNINRNKFKDDNFPSILIAGKNKTIKKLLIEGYNSTESTEAKPQTINHIEINGAKVNYMSITNSTITRDHPVNNSPLLCVKDGGSVDVLQMDNIYCKGISNVVDAEGRIEHISASNIIHTEAEEGEGTFKAGEGIAIPNIVLTNYTGEKPISGKGKILITRGDEFTKSATVRKCESVVNNYKTVLILGNSIVQHPKKPDIGWYGDWGMAASVKDSDFVHRFIQDIYHVDPAVKVRFKNIAEFEIHFDTYSLSDLDSLKNPDILIIKIAENVDDAKALKDNFMNYYDKLVKYIAPHKRSIKIIVDGFWSNKHVNHLIEKYALKKKYSFVSITDLSKDSTNTALGKFEHKGVASHPSDKGMRMIEQKIWNSVKPYFEK